MKAIKMQCISHEKCTDDTCKHKEEHEKNIGCDYYCHHSDFQLLCKPTSKGINRLIDICRLQINQWIVDIKGIKKG